MMYSTILHVHTETTLLPDADGATPLGPSLTLGEVTPEGLQDWRVHSVHLADCLGAGVQPLVPNNPAIAHHKFIT